MRAIAITNFCVALLLTIVSGDFQRDMTIKDLNEMADAGVMINDMFIPSKNGLLGSGHYGFTYEGRLLLEKPIIVAMKFVHFNKKYGSDSEYKAYTYLDAFNTDVETYGIPTIYYYGTWSNHTILAMKSLDPNYQTRIKAEGFSEWDLLVLFREFVKIIKYVHSKGIVHYSINFENMIIHEGQGFMFGFCESMDMASRSHESNIRDAKSDFEHLIFTLLLNSTHLLPGWPWFELTAEEERWPKPHFTKLQKIARENKWGHVTGVKRVFLEFTKLACNINTKDIADANENEIPFHDQLYQLIIEEMGDEVSRPIPSIPNPFGPEHDFRESRPEVKPDLFDKKYDLRKVLNHIDWTKKREKMERAMHAEEKKKNEKASSSCGLKNFWSRKNKD